MRWLLLDAGNTRLKWAIWDANPNSQLDKCARLHNIGECRYSCDALLTHLNVLWSSLPDIDNVLLANVADTAIESVIQCYISKRWGLKLKIMSTPGEGNGIKNGYSRSQQLGVDRWAAMLGGWNARPVAGPLWVVDCGTAVTIDFVDMTGQHQGGLILPGLAMMTDQLTGVTHKMSAVADSSSEQNKSAAVIGSLAQDTDAAVRSGVYTSLVSAIDRSVHDLQGESILMITGGDGASLYPLLKGDWVYRPQLVLEGMAIYAEDCA